MSYPTVMIDPLNQTPIGPFRKTWQTWKVQKPRKIVE